MGGRTVRLQSLAIFTLAFCTAALPLWAQNESPYGPQDDSPPTSGQATPDQGVSAGAPAEPQNPAQNAPAQAQGAPAQARARVPATLALPSGTVISVRTTQWLSSDRNHPGDTFSAVLDQPLVANGWVVARRGQMVLGRVDVAQKANQGNGTSELGLEITDLTLVDGRQIPVSTQMQRAASSSSPYSQRDPGRSAATIATTTVLGTIVGAAVGRGVGAAIGAGAGAMAGAAVVLSTRGRATNLAPETPLSFQLQSPVTISTVNSSVAFRPVAQADYRNQDAYGNARPRTGPGWAPYPPGPYYLGAYPYCGWYCYPGPYVGFGFGWGGFGWGGWGWRGGYIGRYRR